MQPNKLTIILAAALFLSLSVNFFLAGLMLGDAVAPAAQAPLPVQNGPQQDIREIRRAEWQRQEQALHAAMSEEDRAVMLRIKQEYDEVFEGLRAALDEARAAVAAATEAEPLDQEVLDDAIATEAAIKSELLQEMTAARIRTVEQLSPEGRKLLREMMPIRRLRGPQDVPPPQRLRPYAPPENPDGRP